MVANTSLAQLSCDIAARYMDSTTIDYKRGATRPFYTRIIYGTTQPMKSNMKMNFTYLASYMAI